MSSFRIIEIELVWDSPEIREYVEYLQQQIVKEAVSVPARLWQVHHAETKRQFLARTAMIRREIEDIMIHHTHHVAKGVIE